jgi:chromosome segregation ATPase
MAYDWFMLALERGPSIIAALISAGGGYVAARVQLRSTRHRAAADLQIAQAAKKSPERELYEQTIDGMRVLLIAAQTTLKETTSALESWREQTDALRTECRELRAECGELREEVAVLNSHVDALKEELRKAGRKIPERPVRRTI